MDDDSSCFQFIKSKVSEVYLPFVSDTRKSCFATNKQTKNPVRDRKRKKKRSSTLAFLEVA